MPKVVRERPQFVHENLGLDLVQDFDQVSAESSAVLSKLVLHPCKYQNALDEEPVLTRVGAVGFGEI